MCIKNSPFQIFLVTLYKQFCNSRLELEHATIISLICTKVNKDIKSNYEPKIDFKAPTDSYTENCSGK